MKSTEIAEIVDELARGSFFGSLELKFEAGLIVLLRKTETIKPETALCRSTRGAEHVGNAS
jgi:hypothetical protein